MGESIKVGDTLWCHDHCNHNEPWFEKTIVGETKQSWLLGNEAFPLKVLKKTMLENMGQYGSRGWYTPEDMAEKRWIDRNRHKIANMIQGCDAATLRRVAILIGYVDVDEAESKKESSR